MRARRIVRSERNGLKFAALPKSAPPPPKTPRSGKIEWVKGHEPGESYANRGPLQVEVQYDFSTRWRRGGYVAEREAPKFQVSIVTSDPKSQTNIRYVYADGVTRGEAKAVAERTLYDTSGPSYVRIENDAHGYNPPERDIQFGLTGGYVVPISARSRIDVEPVIRPGRRSR